MVYNSPMGYQCHENTSEAGFLSHPSGLVCLLASVVTHCILWLMVPVPPLSASHADISVPWFMILISWPRGKGFPLLMTHVNVLNLITFPRLSWHVRYIHNFLDLGCGQFCGRGHSFAYINFWCPSQSSKFLKLASDWFSEL